MATKAFLEQAYLAYFGRPIDLNGVAAFVNSTEAEVENAFWNSAESQALYGTSFGLTQINMVYNMLFGRDAEPAGLAYWANQLVIGAITPAGAAIAILNGAQNEDIIAVNNKLAASAEFTAGLDTTAEILGYSGDAAAAVARTFLESITMTPATPAEVDAAIAAAVAVGGDIGPSQVLTTGVDDIQITTANTINTISGVVDPAGTASTFSVGDHIVGNDHTILNLAVASSGAAAFNTVSKVAEINITAGVAGSVDFNAVTWSEIGAINLANGANGSRVNVDNLQGSADLSVSASVAGTLEVNFTSGASAYLYSDQGSSIKFTDGAVTGVADAGGDVEFGLTSNANGTAITVGDVSLTNADGKGSSGSFWAYQTADKGADVTVGNVTVTGFDGAGAWVYNTDHTAADTAHNVTIGNVAMAANDWLELTIENTSYAKAGVGDLTVGDITQAIGKSGWMESYIENSAYNTAGDLTVGNISLTIGENASGSMTIDNYAEYNGASPSHDVTVGNTTVGDISIAVAKSGSMDTVSVEAYAYAASGSAAVGDFTVGNISATVALNASATDQDFWAYAYTNNGALASIGNFTLGDTAINLSNDSYYSQWASAEAYNSSGAGATIGDVTYGKIDVIAGINSSADIYHSAYAYGTDHTKVSIGNVTAGDISVDANDGANVDVYGLDVESYGSLGNVDMGNLTVTAGVSADVYVENSVSAADNIGDVTIGNVSLTAAKNNGYIWASNYFSAWNGEVGNVTAGDISVSAGANAFAGYGMFVSAETAMGDVTVGNVAVSSVGANASAEAYVTIENDGAGSLGKLTVGDVAMTVKGASAYGYLDISASSAASSGIVTVGNLNLSVGNDAKKTGAYLDAYIYNEDNNVVVGNITLNASSVRAVGDTTMAYDANIYIQSGKSISVGNITVTGGDGAAENFGNFANWLTLTNGGGSNTNTIGNVDYSGYGAAATIDVSSFKGAGAITGTAKADTITDNKGTNVITGGAGADSMTFVTGNANLTAATADQIKGFTYGSDAIKLVSDGAALGGLTVANYGEASYASFGEFITGANAANHLVWVGQVGSDSFVAVDHDGNGTVDYAIELVGVGLSGVAVDSFTFV